MKDGFSSCAISIEDSCAQNWPKLLRKVIIRDTIPVANFTDSDGLEDATGAQLLLHYVLVKSVGITREYRVRLYAAHITRYRVIQGLHEQVQLLLELAGQRVAANFTGTANDFGICSGEEDLHERLLGRLQSIRDMLRKKVFIFLCEAGNIVDHIARVMLNLKLLSVKLCCLLVMRVLILLQVKLMHPA